MTELGLQECWADWVVVEVWTDFVLGKALVVLEVGLGCMENCIVDSPAQ